MWVNLGALDLGYLIGLLSRDAAERPENKPISDGIRTRLQDAWADGQLESNQAFLRAAREQFDDEIQIDGDAVVSRGEEGAYVHMWGWVSNKSAGIMSPLDILTEEYDAWNLKNGLDLGSADEHLFDENLTPEQRAWLRDFSARWEKAEAEAGEET